MGTNTTKRTFADPITSFDEAVREKMQAGCASRSKAVQAVCREQPDLHEAYVLAANPGRSQQTLIRERFEMQAGR